MSYRWVTEGLAPARRWSLAGKGFNSFELPFATTGVAGADAWQQASFGEDLAAP